MNDMPPMMPQAQMPAAPAMAAPQAAAQDPFLGGGEVAPMSAGDEMTGHAAFLEEEMSMAELEGDEAGLANLQAQQSAITDKRALYTMVPDEPTKAFKVPMKKEVPVKTTEQEIESLMIPDDPIVDVIPGPEGALFAVPMSKRGFENDPVLTAIRQDAESIESVCVVVVDGILADIVVLPKGAGEAEFSSAAEELMGLTDLLDQQQAAYRTHWISVPALKKYL